MASSIVDDLFDRLTDAFPPDRHYGPDDLGADPMPAPVAHFLEQLLRRRLDLEMRNMREATSAWVDADHPDVREAAHAFRATLHTHLRIPPGEWGRVLRRAVQRTTAYLIHPTQTMTTFAFGNQDAERAVSTVRERIRFFAPYPYLREAADAFLAREPGDTVRRTRFEAMLRRVDEQTTANYDAAAWMQLLDPLFDLMALTPLRGVPVSFLHTFFQSKGATGIVERLQRTSLEHGAMALDRDDLRPLLAAAPAPSGDSAPEAADAPADADDIAANETDPAPSANAHPTADRDTAPPASETPAPREPTPREPAPPAEPDEPTPLWKQFQGAGESASAPPPSSTAPEPDAASEGAPLWQRFRPAPPDAADEPTADAPSAPDTASDTASDTAPDASEDALESLESLERTVMGRQGPTHRDLFIRELFEDSQRDYRATLERLRDAPDWTRASQIIAQDVFRAHQVNIYSEPAVQFTNAVEDRFRQRR